MVVAALSLGIVSGAAEIAQYVQDTLGSDAWAIMQEWHGRVVRLGLSAPDREGRSRRPGTGTGRTARARPQGSSFIEPLFWRLQREAPRNDSNRWRLPKGWLRRSTPRAFPPSSKLGL